MSCYELLYIQEVLHLQVFRYVLVIPLWGLPFSTYAPIGEEAGVKSPIHFHCILHAKREGRCPDGM